MGTTYAIECVIVTDICLIYRTSQRLDDTERNLKAQSSDFVDLTKEEQSSYQRLQEFREIRAAQDLAYQESLRIDQQKVSCATVLLLTVSSQGSCN
jgi:hypothetical protein